MVTYRANFRSLLYADNNVSAVTAFPYLYFALLEYLVEDTLKAGNIAYKEVSSLEETLPKLDVLYMTRVQKERFFNEEDYIRLKGIYTLDLEKMKLAKQDMPVLHPLPRVDEIAGEVDRDPRAAYFTQVQNGVYIRMALIMALLGIADPMTGKKVLEC